jgi:predicted aspartyl protease
VIPEAPNMENIFINKLIDDENGNCPRTLITINNKYQVNILLDDGAISNIISLDLIKRLGIKELTETQRRYITTNGESSQVLGIAQNIIIGIQGRNIKISIIVYNHDTFPLLLGCKTLKKLKISKNWEKYD